MKKATIEVSGVCAADGEHIVIPACITSGTMEDTVRMNSRKITGLKKLSVMLS